MKTIKTLKKKSKVKELVINYHVTDACNYGCKYCYARWKTSSGSELNCDLKSINSLFHSLWVFFNDRINNPLSEFLIWDNIRLNFAGGEPFLVGNQFNKIIDLAAINNFNSSIITNGSLMTEEFLKNNGNKISMLGISIDSINPDTSIKIGRCNKREEVININKLSNQINLLREINPKVKIKINSVVNSLNYNENLNEIIEKIEPDKWKILQVLPVLRDDLNVTTEQFSIFLEKHKTFKNFIVVEENTSMTDSYIMINPEGKFYQNSNCSNGSKNYQYSSSILEVGVQSAFHEINFNAERFANRY